MELKHVGSGEAAKALIYYITDYITKASLPAHVGLSALLCAINRSRERYRDVPNWEETRSAGALSILVNSMMARLEIPHQQVMSYLVGGGDHYKSDKFRILHYAAFERLVSRHWLLEETDQTGEASNAVANREQIDPGQALASGEPVDITAPCIESLRRADDNVTLVLGSGSISAVNQQYDYLSRPTDDPFASMGLYEYFGMVEKVTLDGESLRIMRRQPQGPSGRRSGRPEEPRALFRPEHPQYRTHLVRKRTLWVIPVLLGEKLPRPDRSDEERERWARAVLTLFKPWRHPTDLKGEFETWYEAYEQYEPRISSEHLAIIHNMNVLSECKDARDKASLARKFAKRPPVMLQSDLSSPDPFDVFATERTRGGVIDGTEPQCSLVDQSEPTLLTELDKNIGIRFRHAIDSWFSPRNEDSLAPHFDGTSSLLTDDMRVRLTAQHAAMRQLKKRRRGPDYGQEYLQDSDRRVRPRLDRPPVLDSMRLDESMSSSSSNGSGVPVYDQENVVDQVVLEKNLRSNPEQLRAFEIVANHVTRGGPQLLMYIGGVGGTGKSHVVNSVLRLFTLLGERQRILVAAPTGAAALLIGGHTIHSLTLLPDCPGKDLQELAKIWDGVDYLILDEVSMIGAKFLSQLNSRLRHAKGYIEDETGLPFGGVNVIFTGDFGQLKPVRDPSLYCHSLVKKAASRAARGMSGISALFGVILWRSVSTVVLLKVNQRQAQDRLYADLLERLRKGECKLADRAGTVSDYALLRTRYADRIPANDPTSFDKFNRAPVIVGRKNIRDLLNLRIMGHHARSLSATVHLYHSKDKIAGQEVTGEDASQLWRVSSSMSNDSLGKFPLFPGMKVMVQENLAFTNRVVNGTEGTVRDIVYEEVNGIRYVSVVYVHIPGSGTICENAADDVVPIFPESSSFVWRRSGKEDVSVSRLQVPLLPSYAYTDYKAQGRSLDAAIIDPVSATTLQGIYVMFSRVRALDGLAILRPFKPAKIEQRLSEELRDELSRLEELDVNTKCSYSSAYSTAM